MLTAAARFCWDISALRSAASMSIESHRLRLGAHVGGSPAPPPDPDAGADGFCREPPAAAAQLLPVLEVLVAFRTFPARVADGCEDGTAAVNAEAKRDGSAGVVSAEYCSTRRVA